MDEKYILEHVDDLTANQLADAVTNGVTTLDKIRATGDLDHSKAKAIKSILKDVEDNSKRQQEQQDAIDDASWDSVRFANELKLSDWVSANPNNRNVNEAKKRIVFLEAERLRRNDEKRGILENINKNPNYYSIDEIKSMLADATINKYDLLECNIPQSAIDNIYEVRDIELRLGTTPSSIPDGYTEVYFWGGTGSGKTCALGALLHMADTKGFLNIAQGPGFYYTNQLKSIFSDDGIANDYLPRPTPAEITQYLPFTLKRSNESQSRSVSLIELSGEIFKCFFDICAGSEFASASHEKTFSTLNTFLRSDNRKIHFFFIDHSRENRPDYNGLRQSDYLSAAANYFKNNNIFNKSTDAIYIVLTKSDLLVDENGVSVAAAERVEYAKEYLRGNYYTSFIETLKTYCKQFGINGGVLTVEPFSLGKVYFGKICDFDGTSAARILNILMDKIPKSRKSILDIFNQ